MSNAICIIGDSGSGKSTSIRDLPPEETFIISATNKPLPFKGFRKNYTLFSKENSSGNYLISDDPQVIIKTLDYIDKKRDEIKYVIIDDFIYVLSNEFMHRANENGFKKFTDIGVHAWQIFDKATKLRADLNVAILTHLEEYIDSAGVRRQKIKTVGKLVDEKVNLEGMLTVVLYTDIVKEGEDQIKHYFLTNSEGLNTCKSPDGMFESLRIPNDLKHVFEKVNEYYG